MSEHLTVEWVDRNREPSCSPDPDYPDGKDISLVGYDGDTCKKNLPYPAKRCGIYIVRCKKCEQSIGCTTAGRPDDPRSIELMCKELKGGVG